jgi:hypothetical protein
LTLSPLFRGGFFVDNNSFACYNISMPMPKKIFVLYFDLHINKKIKRKVFLNGENVNQALEFFLKKIKRDYKGLDISRIKTHKINKKYNGKIITDKQWDRLLYLSYPNTKHKLRLFPTKMWFKPRPTKNRNANGKFKKGNTPWNKNLKIKFSSKDKKGKFIRCRDSLGRFLKGTYPITYGHSKSNTN